MRCSGTCTHRPLNEAKQFIDLVHDQSVQRIGDTDAAHTSLRIYS
jgi:hypothetical protein